MDKNGKSRWIIVAIIAAVVAVATTLVVLALRARAKRKAWYEEPAFDYDVDDADLFEEFEEDAAEDTDSIKF